jgi:LacI family transcriptional regulator
MANIRDVARHAGVSIATVSATLNDRGPVSAETRQRVWDAVKAVGYSPNAVARSLRLGRSRLIGIIVGDITNPFCTALVHAAEKATLDAGYSIIVCNSDDDPEREIMLLDQLRAQHVSGILITATGTGPDYVRKLARSDMPPLVLIDQFIEGLDRDFVGVDNRAAARMLTEYLIRLGHRRIAMIGGRRGLWTADERLAGFRETMQASGIDPDPELCIQAAYRSDIAEKAAVPMLTRLNPPTAIIGGNNVIALGVLQAIVDLGFHCPDDVSVAGIDDVPWSGLVRPRVTTVAQPIEEITRLAVEWLLERISHREPGHAVRRKVFPPRLMAGDSCRDIRLTSDRAAQAAFVPATN